MAKKAWTLLDWYDRDSHPPTDIPTPLGNFNVYWDRLHGARSEGVELLRVNSGPMDPNWCHAPKFDARKC